MLFMLTRCNAASGSLASSLSLSFPCLSLFRKLQSRPSSSTARAWRSNVRECRKVSSLYHVADIPVLSCVYNEQTPRFKRKNLMRLWPNPARHAAAQASRLTSLQEPREKGWRTERYRSCLGSHCTFLGAEDMGVQALALAVR